MMKNSSFLFGDLNLFLFLHSIHASADHTALSFYYEDILSDSHNLLNYGVKADY